MRNPIAYAINKFNSTLNHELFVSTFWWAYTWGGGGGGVDCVRFLCVGDIYGWAYIRNGESVSKLVGLYMGGLYSGGGLYSEVYGMSIG